MNSFNELNAKMCVSARQEDERTHAHAQTHTQTYTRAHTHTDIHAHRHRHRHTHTHTCAQTQTHTPDLPVAGEEAFRFGDLLRSLDLLRRLRPACFSPIASPLLTAILPAALSPLSVVAFALALGGERGALLGSDLRSDTGLSLLRASCALEGGELFVAAPDPTLAVSLPPVGHKPS